MVQIIDKQPLQQGQKKESEAVTAGGCAAMEALYTPLILTHTDYKQSLQISCAIFATDRTKTE